MTTVSQMRPGRSDQQRPPRPVLPDAPLCASHSAGEEAEGRYWCNAVGSGLAVMAGLAPHLDLMSASIVHLPERTAHTRPAVAAYLAAVKQLAASWRAGMRPALLGAGEALAACGASVAQAARKAVATGDAAPAKPTSGPGLALARRMGLAIGLLEQLAGHCREGLDQVARASTALEADTLQLAQRLQSDQLHALVLSQQASTLQSKLDDATMRQHAYWLLGPHAEQIRQEIAMHSSAREGVRRQLDHLRAEQAVTQAETRYLEHLLPSLSTYLAAMDRFSGALRATVGGSRALQEGWGPANRAGQAAAATGEATLAAAVPRWRALGQTVASLRCPPRGSGIMTPGGYRT